MLPFLVCRWNFYNGFLEYLDVVVVVRSTLFEFICIMSGASCLSLTFNAYSLEQMVVLNVMQDFILVWFGVRTTLKVKFFMVLLLLIQQVQLIYYFVLFHHVVFQCIVWNVAHLEISWPDYLIIHRLLLFACFNATIISIIAIHIHGWRADCSIVAYACVCRWHQTWLYCWSDYISIHHLFVIMHRLISHISFLLLNEMVFRAFSSLNICGRHILLLIGDVFNGTVLN